MDAPSMLDEIAATVRETVEIMRELVESSKTLPTEENNDG